MKRDRHHATPVQKTPDPLDDTAEFVSNSDFPNQEGGTQPSRGDGNETIPVYGWSSNGFVH
jgi:hypothetical protein